MQTGNGCKKNKKKKKKKNNERTTKNKGNRERRNTAYTRHEARTVQRPTTICIVVNS